MIRKTNLFYKRKNEDDGVISYSFNEFNTFSNYTEGLTSVIPSTDLKLFPSMFLCYNVENVDETLNTLIQHYENKLACLRDKNLELDNIKKFKLLPLSYLLELLGAPCYIGQVTEQDYNGTYTDIICNINNNCKQEIEITENTSAENYYEINEDTLHGWDNVTELPCEYVNKPIYDKYTIEVEGERQVFENGYLNTSKLSNLKWKTLDINNLSDEEKELNFNIIIPLYNIINTRYGTEYEYNINDDIINEDVEEESEYEYIIDLTTDDIDQKWIPLGIWKSNEVINLKYANGFGASWSVAIGIQFKPFPYSSDYNISEVDNNENNKQSYATFAEVLYKQSDILDRINTIENNIQKYINNKSTPDEVIKRIIEYKEEILRNFQDLKNVVNTEIRAQVDKNTQNISINKGNIGNMNLLSDRTAEQELLEAQVLVDAIIELAEKIGPLGDIDNIPLGIDNITNIVQTINGVINLIKNLNIHTVNERINSKLDKIDDVVKILDNATDEKVPSSLCVYTALEGNGNNILGKQDKRLSNDLHSSDDHNEYPSVYAVNMGLNGKVSNEQIVDNLDGEYSSNSIPNVNAVNSALSRKIDNTLAIRQGSQLSSIILNDLENSTNNVDFACACGEKTIINSNAGFVCGKYNKPENNTLFSIGNGSSNNSRRNMILVTNDKIYLNGLGNYDGTSISSRADDLVYIINNLLNIINGYESGNKYYPGLVDKIKGYDLNGIHYPGLEEKLNDLQERVNTYHPQ